MLGVAKEDDVGWRLCVGQAQALDGAPGCGASLWGDIEGDGVACADRDERLDCDVDVRVGVHVRVHDGGVAEASVDEDVDHWDGDSRQPVGQEAWVEARIVRRSKRE